MVAIASNIEHLRQRIGQMAQGRKVELMAVSKTHPLEAIEEALEAGQRLFGENRVQEAAAKYPALRARWPDLELHMIGPLQTNKVRQAVALFDAIQTLDRPKLAEALAVEMARQKKILRLFVEVNIGREPQKTGLLPEDTPGFLDRCRNEWKIGIAGLMAIPPAGVDPVPSFTQMKGLADSSGLQELSLGMSEDWPQAVLCGATLVRIGTAVFGARKKP